MTGLTSRRTSVSQISVRFSCGSSAEASAPAEAPRDVLQIAAAGRPAADPLVWSCAASRRRRCGRAARDPTEPCWRDGSDPPDRRRSSWPRSATLGALPVAFALGSRVPSVAGRAGLLRALLLRLRPLAIAVALLLGAARAGPLPLARFRARFRSAAVSSLRLRPGAASDGREADVAASPRPCRGRSSPYRDPAPGSVAVIATLPRGGLGATRSGGTSRRRAAARAGVRAGRSRCRGPVRAGGRSARRCRWTGTSPACTAGAFARPPSLASRRPEGPG